MGGGGFFSTEAIEKRSAGSFYNSRRPENRRDWLIEKKGQDDAFL